MKRLEQTLYAGIAFPSVPLLTFLFFLALAPQALRAQDGPLSPRDAKTMTLDDLLNIKVTSVSKNPEKLTEVASAIQVVRSEDIKRSACMRLPEALRLAPNLQVAQSNSHDWAITARGFNGAPLNNNTLADKLLVMIDGRSVYTPLFGGVFWDVQNVLLEDVDRIEVVSGPGGTLWGANAVNGVINIISKSAKETQGLYVSSSVGTLLQDFAGIRYGGKLDSNLFFRVYGQRFDQFSTHLSDTLDGQDKWNMTQGGFRMDYFASKNNTFTLQGDLYGGTEDVPTNTYVNGQNLIGRWTHNFSEQSTTSLQLYYDRTWRRFRVPDFNDELSTIDIDFQHGFLISRRNRLLWGAGYRVMEDKTHNTPSLIFTPEDRTLQLFNTFVQDQIALVPERLELTLGTKLLHNDYTDFEWQPSARLAWTPTENHTVWAAVSRAVRTPARFDVDERTPGLTTKEFVSEKVVAYELGLRLRPTGRVSMSLATFYHVYDDLRSINTNTSPPPEPGLLFANDQKGESAGFELSGNVVALTWWRLRGGFTYLYRNIDPKSELVVPDADLFEAIDPRTQFLLQSNIDFPKNFQLDLIGRYVDMLEGLEGLGLQTVPAYVTFNARLSWQYKYFTISLAGQNLAHNFHREFGVRAIPRSINVQFTFRY